MSRKNVTSAIRPRSSSSTCRARAADENGVHTFGEHKVVWFRDPDGNTLAVDNGGLPSDTAGGE